MLLGGIISAALSSISQIYGDQQAPLWTALVYVALLCVPLAFRRRWPAAVAISVAALYFLAVTFRVPELYVGNFAMFIALYTVGAWLADRRTAAIVRITIIAGMMLWLVVTIYRDAITFADEAEVLAGQMSPYVAYTMLNVLLNLLYFGGAYYFGEHVWRTSRQRLLLEQRTADLERERELTAAQAVALDRVRIARELHDVVAHHVSVMGVQAGAARTVLGTDPTRAAELMTDVETSARTAIAELHNLLETLRSPDGESEDASTLGLADIDALVARAIDAGLPTTYTVVGEAVPVPSVVEVNLYRIAQESLTNARRHAGANATADVRLRYETAAVELEVVNTGRTALSARPGLGQLGMRERAAASGGEIESGPRERGGWRVRVRVPLESQHPSPPKTMETAR